MKGHFQMQMTLTGKTNALPSSAISSPSFSVSSLPSSSHLSQSISNTLVAKNDNLIQSDMIPFSDVEALHLPQNDSPSIQAGGVAFLLALHSNSNFTRKDVAEIQSNVLQNVINPMAANVNEYIEQHFSAISSNDFERRLHLTSIAQIMSNPFRSCETELQLFSWLRENNYMCDFDEFSINKEVGEKYHRGEMQYDEKNVTGVLLPLSFQFRKIFEKNDQLIESLKFVERIEQNTNIYSHFLHGALWREKSKIFRDEGKIALPFFLYIDDSEINNPLGPHADPVTFIYYSFPIIDNCDIYLAALVKGHDYKEFGNEKCLSPLIQAIKQLEENGIVIQTSEGEKTIHFILGLFLGDNLGLNTVLDFTSSFRHSFFCRFCKAMRSTTQTQCIHNPNLSRNRINYAADVAVNDMSSTGIKKNSILCEIKTFHPTENFILDAMHDLYEGVCHYDLCHMINHFISMQYFSLQTLNTRKHMFNYGDIEIGNISPEITEANINKRHLKMTAREMMCFLRLFTLMVGDLVPEDDEVWLLYLNLLDIMDIIESFEISLELAERLRLLITNHHKDYIRLFNDSLKPKHHLMLHYYDVILQSGPPRHYWSFRFEAEHKRFKTYAGNITSRKNICVSLAKKFQLMFANYLMEPLRSTYVLKECHRIQTRHSELIENFCRRFKINSNHIQCYTKCTYRSKKYKMGFFISQYVDVASPENVAIFEIQEILSSVSSKNLYLVCKRTKVLNYHKHFAAFAVDVSDVSETDEFQVLSIDILAGPPVNVHKTARGLNMIRPNQYH